MRWVIIVIVTVCTFVGLLLALNTCRMSRVPESGPKLLAGASEARAVNELEGVPIILRSHLYILDAQASGDPNAERVLERAASAHATPLTDDDLEEMRTNLAALVDARLIERQMSPVVLLLSGSKASFELSQSAAAGGGSPRTTSTFTMDLAPRMFEDGAIAIDARLFAHELAGDLQHLLVQAGLPMGSFAVLELEALAKNGQTVVGFQSLDPSHRIGPAMILLIDVNTVSQSIEVPSRRTEDAE